MIWSNAAGEQRGRLQGCPSGDGFARLVDQDRSAGEVGDDLRIGRASGSATDEGDLTVAAGKVVGTGQEVADDTFDGGTGELLAGDVRADPCGCGSCRHDLSA